MDTEAAVSDTDADEDEGEAGDPTGDPVGPGPAGKGLLLGGISHIHGCIDGCEGFYSDDLFRVEVTWDGWDERPVRIEIHDWTMSDRELQLVDAPLATELPLQPNVPTEVELYTSQDGACTMDSWSGESMRVLITIDGIPWGEEQALSSGYEGFDC